MFKGTALATQLAGSAMSSFDDTASFAEAYFVRAHTLWVQWGAFAVASLLGEREFNVTFQAHLLIMTLDCFSAKQAWKG